MDAGIAGIITEKATNTITVTSTYHYGRRHNVALRHLEHSESCRRENRARERILLVLVHFVLWESNGAVFRDPTKIGGVN